MMDHESTSLVYMGMFSFFYVEKSTSQEAIGILVSRIGLFSGRHSLHQDCIFSMQMAILSRMYPCKECADHFAEILRYNFIFILSSYFCTSIRSQYAFGLFSIKLCTCTISQSLLYNHEQLNVHWLHIWQNKSCTGWISC